MKTALKSIVRDPSLAPEGKLKIAWVQAHMPVLNRIREEFERDQPFKGLRVAISLSVIATLAGSP